MDSYTMEEWSSTVRTETKRSMGGYSRSNIGEIPMNKKFITPPGAEAGGSGPQQPPQQQLNINPRELPDVVCDQCGNYTFMNVSLMKRMSPLISPTSRTAFVPMQVYACAACGNINKEFAEGLGGWFSDETAAKKFESSKEDVGIKTTELPGLEPVAPEVTVDAE
jgi:hypothetical protein